MPEALREAGRHRLDRLPPSARALLDVAAVLGRRFDVATLPASAAEDEAALLDRLDELIRRLLPHDEGGGRHLDFSHDKIREVVYTTSPARGVCCSTAGRPAHWGGSGNPVSRAF